MILTTTTFLILLLCTPFIIAGGFILILLELGKICFSMWLFVKITDLLDEEQLMSRKGLEFVGWNVIMLLFHLVPAILICLILENFPNAAFVILYYEPFYLFFLVISVLILTVDFFIVLTWPFIFVYKKIKGQ